MENENKQFDTDRRFEKLKSTKTKTILSYLTAFLQRATLDTLRPPGAAISVNDAFTMVKASVLKKQKVDIASCSVKRNAKQRFSKPSELAETSLQKAKSNTF